MKKYFTILSAVVFLGISYPSFSAKLTLQAYFQGIDGAPLENVKKRLSIKQQALPSPLTANSIESFYRQAPDEIKNALQPFGYFKAKIRSHLVRKGDAWSAVFQIETGPPLKITGIDLQLRGAGKSDPVFRDYLRSQPLQKGDIFRAKTYESVKQTLFNLALNNGYLKPSMEKNVVSIDLSKYTAVITLHFNTGRRYKFGAVSFSKTAFSEEFLRRFLPFREGDFYAAKKIEELQDNLARSNFFKEVSIIPQSELAKEDYVPIAVKLIPRKSRQYEFGLGFGTDTGVRGLAGLEMRHLTAAGQSFKAFLKASQVQNDLEMHYLIPGRNPVYDLYDLSAAAQTRNEKLGESQTFKVSGGYLTTVFDDWRANLRLNLQHEHYNIEQQPSENSIFLTPSLNLSRIKADDAIKPRRGSRINFFIQGAKKELFSKADFLQAQIDAKMLYPLSSSNMLLLRGTLGCTEVRNLNDLPMTFQYFAGGAQSIRGYGYNSLGPGKDLILASAELRQRIYQDWYLAVFFDAGNAGNKLDMKLKRGAGIGIAWLSPVGTVELTYTQALDSFGKPRLIQFSMGPEF